MRALRVVGAFVRRDWIVARSYRFSFALEAFGQLFYLMLFFYLGRLIDRSGASTADELAQGYFPFAIIGWVVLTLASSGVTYPMLKLRTEQTGGSLEVLLATPPPPALLILAGAAYDLLQATVRAVGFVLVAILLFGLRLEVTWRSSLAAGVALVGSVALFVALGVVVASFTLVFKRSGSLVGMLEAGLGLLSGVYFPIDVLPVPLRVIARALPTTWAIDVPRSALLNGDIMVGHLILLLVAAAAAVPAALWVFKVALDRARRDGSLAQY